MRVLVCVKRVPAPGAKIVLTDDGSAIDTRHLGFTVSPHEECAVEEAVRLVEAHGGHTTVLTLGPQAAEDQLRTAIAMGVNDGVLLRSDISEWDPRATARAIANAIATLEAADGPFDLILFGAESADAGHAQVGIRVAYSLNRPVVSGIKRLTVHDEYVSMFRSVDGGFERCDVPTPAVGAVLEGINVPRYPAMRGRLLAKKAELTVIDVTPDVSDLVTQRFHHPPQQTTETAMLGHGAAAASAIVDVFDEAGLL